MSIHASAVIAPGAEIGPETKIGPYAVIESNVFIGSQCEIGPHVYITGRTFIGDGTKIHAGAVIGDWPQDVRFTGAPTGVTIGTNNVIREHVTIHRSNNPEAPTTIGSNNLLMAHCHVGPNSAIGNHVIIANGALLAGHVTVGDRVFISGTCLLHQFVRIGTFAFMQGGSGVSKDLPPYTIAKGNNTICGLNTIGLRRAGFTNEERLELRRLYHYLFRGKTYLRHAIESARQTFTSPHARVLLDFLASGNRGFCTDRSYSSDAES
jgi:UDP-N-acetylglucosamine acyltransferase